MSVDYSCWLLQMAVLPQSFFQCSSPAYSHTTCPLPLLTCENYTLKQYYLNLKLQNTCINY